MKTIKQLQKEIKEHRLKRVNQGQIYLDDIVDAQKLKTELALRQKTAQVHILDEVINLIEEVFTEGWFNYFHTTYGADDMNINEGMIGNIDKKVQELKKKIKGGKE